MGSRLEGQKFPEFKSAALNIPTYGILHTKLIISQLDIPTWDSQVQPEKSQFKIQQTQSNISFQKKKSSIRG